MDCKLTVYFTTENSDHAEALMQLAIADLKDKEGTEFVHAGWGLLNAKPEDDADYLL